MGITVAELTASIRADGAATAVRSINSVGDAGENTSKRLIDGNARTTDSFARMARNAAFVSAALYGMKKSADVLFQSIDTVKQFEASISDLSAITGATGKDLKFLSDKSREFGAVTTLSASQASEAFKLVASAKPDLLESGKALAQVTKEAIALAEASGSTLPEAAKTLGSSLNQFSADADQAGRFINVLAAGAKFGASEIADTALALQDSGTVAASAGISFEELNASIQALSTVAIKGGRAGTGLRNIILKLQKDGSDLSEETGGLTGALTKLLQSGIKTTEVMQLFGLENTTAAQSLINMSGNLGNLTNKLTGTSVAYEQAAVKVDNLDGDLKKLNSAWEEMQLTLVGSTDPMRTAVQGTTDVVLALTGSMDELAIVGGVVASLLAGKLAKAIAGYANSVVVNIKATNASTIALVKHQKVQVDALRVKASYAAATLSSAKASVAAATGIKKLALAENLLVPAQVKAAAAAAAHTKALSSLKTAATGATVAAKGLKTVMAFLGGPVGAITTAVTALALWSLTSKTAATDTDTLSRSTDDLASSMSQFDIASTIQKAREQLKGFQDNLKVLQETENVDPRSLASVNAMIQTSTSKIERLKQQLIELKERDEDIQNIIAGQGGDDSSASVSNTEETNNASVAALSRSLLNERDLLAASLAERRELVDAFYGEDIAKANEKADLLFRIEEDYESSIEALDAKALARKSAEEDNLKAQTESHKQSLQSKLDNLERSWMSQEELEAESYARSQELLQEANENKLLTDDELLVAESQLFYAHQQKLTTFAEKGEAKRRAVRVAGLGAAANIFSGLSALMDQEGKKQNIAQKRLAQAGIIMSTAQAVMNAYTVLPFPLGASLAVGVALQGALQLKRLNSAGSSSVQMPSVSSARSQENQSIGIDTSELVGQRRDESSAVSASPQITINNYGAITPDSFSDLVLPIIRDAVDIERLTIEIEGQQAEVRVI